MVTFKPLGRQGNFLFEFATAYSYALKHGLEFSMPSSTNDAKWNPIYFPHLIHPDYNPNAETVVIQEKTYFKFDELPFEESWRNKNIVLDGYFQSYNYFDHNRDSIIKFLGFDQYEMADKLVSVQVRRGDYITLREKHPEVTDQWYINAMKSFPTDYKFIFFSDDIEYCKQAFGNLENVSFSNGKSEMEDLIMMSQCSDQICSASTFSWWGAYLNRNPNKRVIMPKQWMTLEHSNEWTEEIVMKNWDRV